MLLMAAAVRRVFSRQGVFLPQAETNKTWCLSHKASMILEEYMADGISITRNPEYMRL
jgi:hypothetical protein